MRKILPFVAAILFLAGCAITQSRVAYNTLYSTHVAVDSAYLGYTTLVLKGAVPTNDVPKVADAYRKFQSAFNLAIWTCRFESNAIAPAAVASAAADVVSKIAKAEKP